MNFEELRNKYTEFIYDKYEIKEDNESINITYYFEIPGLTTFKPSYKIDKKVIKKDIDEFSKYLIFHIGLVELISYWKCACPKKVIINAGYINNEQISFFKKLYYYGLGEFFYVNNIDISIDDFMDIEVNGVEKEYKVDYNGHGNLIPIGGGKDSCVSLELLKDMDNTPFIINPKETHLKCAYEAGYTDDEIITIRRILDRKIVELNNEGYLNGHTPFSSLVSFVTYLMAYLTNKKYIVLSNEDSSNESTVIGTKINHQYSKTYEYENDFNEYTKKFFNIDIKYFSFLRPLSEFQISLLFSNYKKYHKVFKSCNVGSKETPWVWCGKCAKCLFVYIVLSPKLYKDSLVDIFGKDLYEDESLLPIFKELIGDAKTKPFECVGTIKEVRYAISLTINKLDELPYLLKYYKDNYDMVEEPLENNYNEINNLPKEYEDIIKENLKCIMK
ncbi:MAG: hypothetical protein IJ565_06255 [Bacilli bacterium]|nr:hypothetical protein [Bacilli bacterium]